jgi:hypothetical protein
LQIQTNGVHQLKVTTVWVWINQSKKSFN